MDAIRSRRKRREIEMNKQELIKYFEDMPYVSVVQMGKKSFINMIEKLDEPQKTVVPQFVADWIERERKSGGDLEDLFNDIVYEQDHIEWFREEENMNLVARAWLDGFEVEKEKKYKVKFKNIQSGTRYLKYDGVIEKWYFGINQDSNAARLYHTRKELEEAGFGEVFNSPLFEVEEVEE